MCGGQSDQLAIVPLRPGLGECRVGRRAQPGQVLSRVTCGRRPLAGEVSGSTRGAQVRGGQQCHANGSASVRCSFTAPTVPDQRAGPSMAVSQLCTGALVTQPCFKPWSARTAYSPCCQPAGGRGTTASNSHGGTVGSPWSVARSCSGPVAFSPDGQDLTAGSYDRAFRLWNVAEPNQPELPSTGDVGADLQSVALSPDGKTLATGRTVRHHRSAKSQQHSQPRWAERRGWGSGIQPGSAHAHQRRRRSHCAVLGNRPRSSGRAHLRQREPTDHVGRMVRLLLQRGLPTTVLPPRIPGDP
jgi:hypothetical protein